MRTLEEVRALIARGLEGDPRYTVDDVIEGLHTGEFHYFGEDKGIVITKFSGYRDKRLLVFLLVGEDLDEWKEKMTARLKGFAEKHGCSQIECYARRGLEKSLRALGWKHEQSVLRLRIKNGR